MRLDLAIFVAMALAVLCAVSGCVAGDGGQCKPHVFTIGC